MFRAITQFWWAGVFAWAEVLDFVSGPPDSPWSGDAKVVDLDAERTRRGRFGRRRQRGRE
jgi:hypothetical protein